MNNKKKTIKTSKIDDILEKNSISLQEAFPIREEGEKYRIAKVLIQGKVEKRIFDILIFKCCYRLLDITKAPLSQEAFPA